MKVDQLFDSFVLTSPPPGAVNVRTGSAIEGPGGRWIPCASALADQSFVSCVYEVGPGRRQVCDASVPIACPEEALSHAIELAVTAAA